MQQRIIDPPKDQWHRLPTPLTSGENEVYNLFDTGLSLEWEMYIQPHLNGLRPDLVLLNPHAGIAVFEIIKDWSLNTLQYSTRYNWATQSSINQIKLYEDEIFNLYCPRLDDRYGKAVITAGIIFTQIPQAEVDRLLNPFRDGNMKNYPDQYPFSGSEHVTEGNIDALFPEHKKWGQQRQSYYMSEDLANDLRGWLKEPAFSKEQREPLGMDLRDRQRREIVRNQQQTRYRRVKGPAGSGKSLALAARGAELANQGKRVLVCTFNITLINYLRDLAARHARELTAQQTIHSRIIRQQIEYRHFHGWFRRICTVTGYKKDYDHLWEEFFPRFVVRGFGPEITENDLRRYFGSVGQVEEITISVSRRMKQESTNFNTNYAVVKMATPRAASTVVETSDHFLRGYTLRVKREEEILNRHMPEIIQRIYEDPSVSDVRPIYDAVLVDEGQDYCPIWWDTLRKAVTPNEEMLLIADKTQDIYGTADVWTDAAMIGAGFSGDWMELKNSYRLPPEIVPILKDFAENFLIPAGIEVDLPTEPEDEEPESDSNMPIELRWVQVSSVQVSSVTSIVEICFEEVRRQMQHLRNDTAIPDVIFLTPRNDIGRVFVERCEEKGIRVLYTFGQEDQESDIFNEENGDVRKHEDSRRRKLAFFLGNAKIKATTLHSFKGWEGRHLVLYVSRIASAEDRALFYTALTRLKKHPSGSMLTVVSSCRELYSFGERRFSPNFLPR